MKRIFIGLASFALAFSFSACEDDTNPDGVIVYDDGYEPNDPGGIGMTYNGKLGYDWGGGYVQPFDGSAPGFGYGF